MSPSNTIAAITETHIESFESLCRQIPDLSQFPLAIDIQKRIPIYQAGALQSEIERPSSESVLATEWRHCLSQGPGVFVVQSAYADLIVIDQMTDAFRAIIAREKANGQGQGDHFGDNERIWNSIQKTCLEAPELFASYYGNPYLALACRAWLGPRYQLTAQVNIVKPGGAAQSPHRDYHLGFQSDATTAQFPLHAQVMSQYLTLQGSIIHSDMPVESGPTILLPFSQQFKLGYQGFRHPRLVDYFQNNAIQLPLKKGDLVFFNPALFHAGGSNTTSADRIANLVQISSAFGRPMETVNRQRMIEAVYPGLLQSQQQAALTPQQWSDTLAALADSYAFPTNLDSDPPLDGNAPMTQRALLEQALKEAWSWKRLKGALDDYQDRRKA